MASDGSIKIDTQLDTTTLNTQLSSIKSSLGSGLATLAKTGAAAMVALTAAVTAFAVSAAKDLIDFDSSMKEVFTLMPGMSEEAMDLMSQDVKDLATDMRVLPEDVIPALYQALSAGVDSDNVFTFLEESQKLATAGVAELDDSVGVLTTIINSYGKEMISASEASDSLFTAVKLGVTSIPELATKLGDVIPSASAAGVTFQEVSASVSTMTSLMGKGSTSTAITQLKTMINELSQAGTQASEAFTEVAGVGFKDFLAGGGDMEEAMALLAEQAENTNVGINDLFSSSEAGAAALILAGVGADKFTTDLEANATAAGATQTAYETMATGAQWSIDGITSSLAVLKLDMAEEFAPAVDDMLSAVVGAFSGTEGSFELFSDAFSSMLDTILTMVVEFLPYAIDLGSDVLNSLISGITDNLGTLSVAVESIITGLVSLITDNLPEIIAIGVSLIVSVISGIVQSIPDILSAIAYLLGLVIGVIIQYASYFYDQGVELVVSIIDGISSWLSNVWGKAVEIVTNVVNAITSKASEVYNAGKSLVLEIISAIADFAVELYDETIELVGNIKDAIVDKATEIFDAAKDIGGFLVDGFVNGITGLWDSATGTITGLFDGVVTGVKDLLGIHSPSTVFAEIGENVDDGFRQGIEDGKNGIMGDMTTLGQESVEALTDGTASMTGAATSAGVGIGDALGEGVETGVSGAMSSVESIFSGVIENITAKTQTLSETLADVSDIALSGLGDALTDVGEALYNGEDAWASLGDSALGVLADVLAALGAQLIAQAVVHAIALDLSGAAIATAGAAAAYVASGWISASIGSYAVGTTGLNQDGLYYGHEGEAIIPKGIMQEAKESGITIQASNAVAENSTRVSNMSASIYATIQNVLTVDGSEMARVVFQYTDENVALAY